MRTLIIRQIAARFFLSSLSLTMVQGAEPLEVSGSQETAQQVEVLPPVNYREFATLATTLSYLSEDFYKMLKDTEKELKLLEENGADVSNMLLNLKTIREEYVKNSVTIAEHLDEMSEVHNNLYEGLQEIQRAQKISKQTQKKKKFMAFLSPILSVVTSKTIPDRSEPS